MELDNKTLRNIGLGAVVAAPIIFKLVVWLFAAQATWIATQHRLDKLERYRCAMGGHPPETIDWKRVCPPED